MEAEPGPRIPRLHLDADMGKRHDENVRIILAGIELGEAAAEAGLRDGDQASVDVLAADPDAIRELNERIDRLRQE